MERVLITGALGQIGAEIVDALRSSGDAAFVLATDIYTPDAEPTGPFALLDVCDKNAIATILDEHRIDTVFHLASLLSAVSEGAPERAWSVNVDGLRSVLDLAKERSCRLFWPSSIAAFGPDVPSPAPQSPELNPTSVYGVTKVVGEKLCRYYADVHGMDIRSIRYPGLISHRTKPGGGTTDYAVHIFHDALATKSYTSFLASDAALPMMYMRDAVRATIELMTADPASLSPGRAYNIAAVSFTPSEIADEIKQHIPALSVDYKPDFRQEIAASWPGAIDDAEARSDWGWRHEFDLPAIVSDMLNHISQSLGVPNV